MKRRPLNLFEDRVYVPGHLTHRIRCRMCRRVFVNWQGTHAHGMAEVRKHPITVRYRGDLHSSRYAFEVVLQ